MMKLPSAVAGGRAPSGNSFAATYPGVFGSRVGGTGRAPWASTSVAADARLNTSATINRDALIIRPLVLLLKRKRIQGIARRDDDVLAAVEQMRLRPFARIRTKTGMPKRLAGCGVVGDKVAAAATPEQEAARRAQESD